MIKKISYLGLGTMASGMASNLLKADYQLTVWDRTLANCEPFARKGARGNENASALIKALESEAGVEVDGGRTTI